ncbi:hypothetical protein [uncultured Croceitalea sp.]|uniref:hypothetical protein n=1 Tax=uncultured Croceitalea sp. TaxID=1798908 RepID=UPI00374EA19E
MKLSLKDKLHFTKVSLRKNSGPLLIMLLFIVIGAFLIYLGLRTNTTFLWIFGIVFGGIPLLILIFTMPSSFLYYYEQAQTKKYGAYGTAKIIEKEEKDVSYFTRKNKIEQKTEEFQYFLTYTFEYNNTNYHNTFLVVGKNCFGTLTEGASIPIRFLRSNPKKSTVRRRKLAKELGLPLKDCQ